MAIETDQAKVERVIAFARAQIGKPYVFGSSGPDTWDCSGLTMKAYGQVGITLAHSTYINVTQGRAVKPDLSVMQPGDLILPHAGHIQLYIGNGRQIEAYDTGYPVREAPVSKMWRVRRMLSDGLAGTSGTTTGPVTAVTGTGTSSFLGLDGVGDALSSLGNAHNWVRIGMFIAGALAIIFGLMSVLKGNLLP